VKNRYFLLGITGVLAISLAVPAFGGPSNPVASSAASAKTVAKRALSAANSAQNTANTALSTANSARTTANTAQTTATQARTAADEAKAIAATKLGPATSQNGDQSPSNPTGPKQIISSCPAGKLLSGGYITAGANQNDLTATVNTPYADSWVTTIEEGDAVATNWSVLGIVQCAG
jgi:hypothetical protein